MPTINIIASQDIFAREDQPAIVQGPAEDFGGMNQGSHRRKPFWKWDNSDIFSNVPRPATIISATLYIYCGTAQANSNAVQTKVCDADFSDTTLTWNNMPAVSGSDIGGNVFNYSATGWKNAIITATFFGWFRQSANNYGIVQSNIYFDAGENAITRLGHDGTNDAYITVEYQPNSPFMIFI